MLSANGKILAGALVATLALLCIQPEPVQNHMDRGQKSKGMHYDYDDMRDDRDYSSHGSSHDDMMDDMMDKSGDGRRAPSGMMPREMSSGFSPNKPMDYDTMMMSAAEEEEDEANYQRGLRKGNNSNRRRRPSGGPKIQRPSRDDSSKSKPDSQKLKDVFSDNRGALKTGEILLVSEQPLSDRMKECLNEGNALHCINMTLTHSYDGFKEAKCCETLYNHCKTEQICELSDICRNVPKCPPNVGPVRGLKDSQHKSSISRVNHEMDSSGKRRMVTKPLNDFRRKSSNHY